MAFYDSSSIFAINCQVKCSTQSFKKCFKNNMSFSNKYYLLFALLIFLVRPIISQQYYDGYPNQFTSYRTFNKSAGSFIQFRNMLDLSGSLLQSYAFEFYLRLKSIYNTQPLQSTTSATVNTSQGTFTLADQRGSLIDCGSHSKVTIDSQKLQYVQVGGQQLQYNFAAGEFQTTFLDQWRHLSFSYQNGTQSSMSNSTIYPMRIHVDGILKSQFNFSIAISNQVFSVTRDLCYIGNAQPSFQTLATSLHADIKYFVMYQTARIQNYRDEVYHMYPSPDRPSMVLYFKLDEANTSSVDYYWNRTVSDVGFRNGVSLVNAIEKERLCECYSQPQNYLQIRRGQSNSQGIVLQAIDDVASQGFLLEFWILIQGNLDDGVVASATVKTIIFAERMIRVMTQGKLLMIQIGNSSTNFTIQNATLYFRRWKQIGIAVYPNQTAEVYRNGQMVQSFSFNSTVSNQQMIQVRHEITALLGRLRLLKNIQRMQSVSSYMRERFLIGVTDNFSFLNYSVQQQVNASFIQNSIVFDFVFSDLAFASYSYSSATSLYSGQYAWNSSTFSTLQATTTQPQIYRFIFEKAAFVYENTLCGRDGLWVNTFNDSSPGEDFGACYEPKMVKTFSSSDSGSSNKIFSGAIRSVFQEMTLSFWFNYQRNRNSQSSVLMAVLQQFNLQDRFRAEIYFNTSTTLDNIGVGSFDQGSGFLIFNQSVVQNQWFHLTWQCKQSSNTAQAYLFNYANRQSLSREARGSISQPNVVNSRTFVGGDSQGSRRLIGQIKELRIWFSYQTAAEIIQQRNIVPKDLASQSALMHYYRFDGDNSFTSLQDYLQINQSSAFDLTISSTVPIDSTIRYFSDQSSPNLTLCEFGTFLTSKFYCAFYSEFSFKFVSYKDLSTGNVWLYSNAVFYNEDPEDFYIVYSLVSLSGASLQDLARYQSLFNRTSVQNFNISLFKLPKDAQYTINLSINNLMYPAESMQSQQLVFDNSCPSFNFNQYDQVEQTVYLYNQPNQNYTVNLLNNTQCLFQDFFDAKIHNCSWQLIKISGNLNRSISTLLNLSLTQNQTSISIVQLQTLPSDLQLTFNISLTYKNSYILSLNQTYWQTLNIKFVTSNIALVFNKNPYKVISGQDLSLDASSSFVLLPPYQSRDVQFQIRCPTSLFISQAAYNDICYIDLFGRFRIDSNSISRRMNVEINVINEFIVTGNIKLNPEFQTSKVVYVQFVSLSPPTQICPLISIPSLINITTLVSETKIFPYYSLTCDRGSYIASYDILQLTYSLDLTNVSFFRDIQREQILLELYPNQSNSENETDQGNSFITEVQLEDMVSQHLLDVNYSNPLLGRVLDLRSNNTLSFLQNETRWGMKIGEKIKINISYLLTSEELEGASQSTQIGTILEKIPTDFVYKLVTNNNTLVFRWNETILLDILNTNDPQDPGVILNFFWSCPRPDSNSDIGFCKNESSMSSIQLTPYHRFIMNWKYETNYSINATVINPLSRKQQLIQFTVLVTRPPKTNFTQVCPYFDFQQTNQIAIKLDNEDTLIYASNTPSQIINITYPFYSTSCGVQNFTFIGILFDDPQQIILTDQFAPDLAARVNSFSTGNQIALNLTNSSQIFSSSVQYSIWVYLLYTDTPSTANTHFYSYSKQIFLQLSDRNSILISNFDTSYRAIFSNELMIINGSSSYDTQNIKNRNFNYNWRCPTQLLNQTICSNSVTRSILSFTSSERNTLGINQPGQNYKFGLQIFDGIRQSEWSYSSVFIRPNSSNGQCLQLGIADPSLTRNIDQNFMYPLLRELSINQSCLGIQYTSLVNRISLVQSSQANSTTNLITDSYIRISRDIIRIPYNLVQQSDMQFYFAYTISYSIGQDYTDSQQYLDTFTFKKFVASNPASPDQFYIQSNSFFNLATDNEVSFTVIAFDQALNSSFGNTSLQQLQFQWRCDSALGLNTQCNSNRNNTLIIKKSDRNFTSLVNRVFSIQVTVNFQTYQMYFQVLNFSFQSLPQSCFIESNQPSFVNASQLLLLQLSCSDSDQRILQKLNPIYKWSLSPLDSLNSFLGGKIDNQQVIVKPGGLLQGRSYFLNLTVTSFGNLINLSFPYQFTTSQFQVSQILQTSDFTFSPRSGSYFETSFSVRMGSNWGTSISTLKLNLFYSVILTLNDGSFFYWQPMTLVPRNLTLDLGSLPEHSRMVIEIRNNYGQISTNLITGLVITTNNRTNASILYANRTQTLDALDNNPVLQIRTLLQIVQIINRTDYQVSSIQKQKDFQFILNQITSVRVYLQENSYLFCYLDQHCLDLVKNLLLLQGYSFSSYNLNFTVAQAEQMLENLYFLLNDSSLIITDYNANIDYQIEAFLRKLELQSSFDLDLYSQNTRYGTIVNLLLQRQLEFKIALMGSSSIISNFLIKGQTYFVAPLQKFSIFNFQENNAGYAIKIDQAFQSSFPQKQENNNLFVGQSKYPRAIFSSIQNNQSDETTIYLTNSTINLDIYSKQGYALNISNLSDKIQLSFVYQGVFKESTLIQDSICVFMNQASGEWQQGDKQTRNYVETIIDEDASMIKCLTSHLSTFTVISIYKKNRSKPFKRIKEKSLYEQSAEKYLFIAIPILVIFLMIEAFGFYSFSIQSDGLIKTLRALGSKKLKSNNPTSDIVSESSARSLVDNETIHILTKFQVLICLIKEMLIIASSRQILWTKIANAFSLLFAYGLFVSLYFALRTQIEGFMITESRYLDSLVAAFICVMLLLVPLARLNDYLSQLRHQKLILNSLTEGPKELKSKEKIQTVHNDLKTQQSSKTLAEEKKYPSVKDLIDCRDEKNSQGSQTANPSMKKRYKSITSKPKNKDSMLTIQQIMAMDDQQQEMHSGKNFLREDDQSYFNEKDQSGKESSRSFKIADIVRKRASSKSSIFFGKEQTSSQRRVESYLVSSDSHIETLDQKASMFRTMQQDKFQFKQQNERKNHHQKGFNDIQITNPLSLTSIHSQGNQTLSFAISDDIDSPKEITIPTVGNLLLTQKFALQQDTNLSNLKYTPQSFYSGNQADDIDGPPSARQKPHYSTQLVGASAGQKHEFQAQNSSASHSVSPNKKQQLRQVSQAQILEKAVEEYKDVGEDGALTVEKQQISMEFEGGEDESNQTLNKGFETKLQTKFKQTTNENNQAREQIALTQNIFNIEPETNNLGASRQNESNSINGLQYTHTFENQQVGHDQVKLSFEELKLNERLDATPKQADSQGNNNFVNVYSSNFSNNNIFIINSHGQSYPNHVDESQLHALSSLTPHHFFQLRNPKQINDFSQSNNFLYSSNLSQLYNRNLGAQFSPNERNNHRDMDQEGNTQNLRLNTSQFNQQIYSSTNTGAQTKTFNNISTNLTHSQTPLSQRLQFHKTQSSNSVINEKQRQTQAKFVPKISETNLEKEMKTKTHQDRIWQAQQESQRIKSKLIIIFAINTVQLLLILILFGVISENNLIAALICLVIATCILFISSVLIALYLRSKVIQSIVPKNYTKQDDIANLSQKSQNETLNVREQNGPQDSIQDQNTFKNSEFRSAKRLFDEEDKQLQNEKQRPKLMLSIEIHKSKTIFGRLINKYLIGDNVIKIAKEQLLLKARQQRSK